MRILFVGDLNEYGRSFQRYRTLVGLGYQVLAFSMVPVPQPPGKEELPFFVRLFSKLRMPLDITSVNKKIRGGVKRDDYDIVWIEKGNTIRPGTLRFIKAKLPSVRLISLSEDDMYASHNRSLYYRWGLRYYDFVFTTKTYNLEELKYFGAKQTVLFLDAFDEMSHRPLILNEDDKNQFGCDVGFIGTYEEDRAMKMLFLAENGIKVTVWGNGWEKWVGKNPNLMIKNRPLLGEDYVKAINATKISLCFLRKLNRDEVTSRSVEIPACGGFMLAERTQRHLEFFRNSEEAVFFENREELLASVAKYLVDSESRERIALAGRARCLRSGYSHRDQLSHILQIVSNSQSGQ